MRRARLAACAALLSAGIARAGGGYAESPRRLGPLVSLTWEAARPLGSLRDHVEATSLQGGQVEIRGAVASHLSLGLAGSWSWFAREAGQDTLQVGDATITGPAYRRNQAFTLRATGHWYLTGGTVQPYLGVGVGGAWVDTYETLSSSAWTAHAVGLAVDPQVGLLVAIRRGLAVHLQVRWQLTNVRIGRVEDQSWASLGIGIAGF